MRVRTPSSSLSVRFCDGCCCAVPLFTLALSPRLDGMFSELLLLLSENGTRTDETGTRTVDWLLDVSGDVMRRCCWS